MPPSPASSTGISRRAAVLAVAAGLGAAISGCTTSGDSPVQPTPGVPPAAGGSASSPSGTVDDTSGLAADAPMMIDASGAVSAALDAVMATVAVHRGLRPLSRPLVSSHQRHLAVLEEALVGAATSSAGATPSAGEPGRYAVPRSAVLARRKLAAVEAELARSLAGSARAASSGSVARVLASMAASAASSAAWLSDPAES